MKTIDREKYMKALENALEKATYRNKEKIVEIVKSDYLKGRISEKIYQEANKEIEEHFKNNMRARIKITKYATKKEAEEALGVKIQGHAINEIIEKEDEEER